MTDSTAPSSPSPRHRGGQPGNSNALKHGFYTRRLPGLKDAGLEALDTEFPGMEEEIFLLRAYIRRTLEWSAACCDFNDGILLLRTLCLALSTLARLTREHRIMTASETPVDTLAAMRQAHTGIDQTEKLAGQFNDFLDSLMQVYPDLTDEEILSARADAIPPETFDPGKKEPAADVESGLKNEQGQAAEGDPAWISIRKTEAPLVSPLPIKLLDLGDPATLCGEGEISIEELVRNNPRSLPARIARANNLNPDFTPKWLKKKDLLPSARDIERLPKFVPSDSPDRAAPVPGS